METITTPIIKKTKNKLELHKLNLVIKSFIILILFSIGYLFIDLMLHGEIIPMVNVLNGIFLLIFFCCLIGSLLLRFFDEEKYFPFQSILIFIISALVPIMVGLNAKNANVLFLKHIWPINVFVLESMIILIILFFLILIIQLSYVSPNGYYCDVIYDKVDSIKLEEIINKYSKTFNMNYKKRESKFLYNIYILFFNSEQKKEIYMVYFPTKLRLLIKFYEPNLINFNIILFKRILP